MVGWLKTSMLWRKSAVPQSRLNQNPSPMKRTNSNSKYGKGYFLQQLGVVISGKKVGGGLKSNGYFTNPTATFRESCKTVFVPVSLHCKGDATVFEISRCTEKTTLAPGTQANDRQQ